MDSACSKIPVQLSHSDVAAPTILLDYKMPGADALVQGGSAHAQHARGLHDFEPEVRPGMIGK